MRTNHVEPLEKSIRRNARETARSWRKAPYYEVAENDMSWQWEEIIFPKIQDVDFASVLELAPGHGRNSERLKNLAGELHLVDANRSCIRACKRRFATRDGPCRIHYHVNNGRSLAMIASESITLAYSWDSMVHFDKLLVERYVQEFARVLRPGGRGFVHHSNLGADPDYREAAWNENPHWRSNTTKELFQDYCAAAGLRTVSQDLLCWAGVLALDCVSVFEKPVIAPASREQS